MTDDDDESFVEGVVVSEEVFSHGIDVDRLIEVSVPTFAGAMFPEEAVAPDHAMKKLALWLVGQFDDEQYAALLGNLILMAGDNVLGKLNINFDLPEKGGSGVSQ